VALLLVAPSTRADEDDPWRWIHVPATYRAPVAMAPDLTDDEVARGHAALRSTCSLAVTAPGRRPADATVVGTGVVVAEGGLVAVPWRIAVTVGEARSLWLRPEPDGRWQAGAVVGATWWADTGLVRAADPEPLGPPLDWATVDRDARGDRFVAVGAARGRGRVVSVGRLGALEWLDPDAASGVTVADERGDPPGGRAAVLVALRFDRALATTHGGGAAVVDASGHLVGLVSETGSDDATVLVRPAALVRPVHDAIGRDGAFDPLVLGVRFAPRPVGHGVAAPVPPALERSRQRVNGGALVTWVDADGPANRVLWEGEIVLAIEGRPVVGERYESLALALLALHEHVPADLLVFRDQEPVSVQVTPVRASAWVRNVTRWHDREGERLPRLP
jgi:S1-C subfamily serine protease